MVIGDLTDLGYDCEWCIVSASDIGAPHKRDRFWLKAKQREVADSTSDRPHQQANECLLEGEGRGEFQSEQPRDTNDVAHAHQHTGHQRRAGDAEQGAGRRDADRSTERPDAMANTSGTGLQRSEQPGTLRNERDGEEAHGSTGECGRSPGSSIRHTPNAGLPHGIDRTMGQPGAEPESERSDWWATEPDVGRVANGVAARVDRLKAIGNGQVAAVAATAWRLLDDLP